MKENEGNAITLTDVGAAGAASAASSVPKELAKFVGADGKLDTSKLSQGYLDAEKKVTIEAQKRAEAERAYQMAVTIGAPVPAAAGDESRFEASGELPVDDAGDQPVTSRDARPVMQTLLTLTHPELSLDEMGKPKDPEFYDGLLRYMRGMPPRIKAAIKAGDFEMVEWAVREYKAFAKTKAGASGGARGGAVPNFVEGNSPSGGASAGTVYSRNNMRSLMLHNPSEYARLSEDYGKALKEGRVKE